MSVPTAHACTIPFGTHFRLSYCNATVLENSLSWYRSIFFPTNRRSIFCTKSEAPIFRKIDGSIWTCKIWQPIISPETCTSHVSYCCTFLYHSLRYTSEYHTALRLWWKSSSSYGFISISNNEASIFCLKIGAPMYWEKDGTIWTLKFCQLIFQLKSVRTTSVLTAHAGTNVWNIAQSILLPYDYIENIRWKKDDSIWTWKCTTLLHMYVKLSAYYTKSFYRSLYISTAINQYALSFHPFYQLDNVLLNNGKQVEAPRLQTCFLWIPIGILLQYWSTWGEVSEWERARREFDWHRRSGNWYVLQQLAGRLRWRARWHGRFGKCAAQYSCGRTDCGSTGQ